MVDLLRGGKGCEAVNRAGRREGWSLASVVVCFGKDGS